MSMIFKILISKDKNHITHCTYSSLAKQKLSIWKYYPW